MTLHNSFFSSEFSCPSTERKLKNDEHDSDDAVSLTAHVVGVILTACHWAWREKKVPCWRERCTLERLRSGAQIFWESAERYLEYFCGATWFERNDNRTWEVMVIMLLTLSTLKFLGNGSSPSFLTVLWWTDTSSTDFHTRASVICCKAFGSFFQSVGNSSKSLRWLIHILFAFL